LEAKRTPLDYVVYLADEIHRRCMELYNSEAAWRERCSFAEAIRQLHLGKSPEVPAPPAEDPQMVQAQALRHLRQQLALVAGPAVQQAHRSGVGWGDAEVRIDKLLQVCDALESWAKLNPGLGVWWARADGEPDERHMGRILNPPESVAAAGREESDLMEQYLVARTAVRRMALALASTQPAPPSLPQPAAAPLAIRGGQVLIEGSPVELDLTAEAREEALCFLGHVIAQGGGWISGPEIAEAERKQSGRDLRGTRWDRLVKKLPPEIRKHIESDRRKGYRVR
jgi:hypothetical protein